MKNVTIKSLLSVLVLLAFWLGCTSDNANSGQEITEMPVSTTSQEAKTAFLAGLDTWDMGSQQEAHAHFVKALELDPKLAIAMVFEGATSGTAEGFGTGIANAKANLENASDYEKQMVALVETYAKNDSETRLDIAEKMANDYPKVARAQVFLGYSHWDRNEVQKARSCFQKAITLDPEWVGAYDALARSLLFSEPKNYVLAEQNAAKLVSLAPENAHAHILLGDCFRAQNDLAKALDAYAKAVELNPKDAATYFKKGHANTFLGNLDAARLDFQTGSKFDENRNVTMEAYTYLYGNEPDKALNFLEDKATNIQALGLAADRINGAKLGILDNCAWIAFHLNQPAKLKNFKDQMTPLSVSESKGIGTTEAMIEHEAGMLFWDALIATSEGKTQEAEAKLAAMNSSLEPIKNPRKLEGYYFAGGILKMKNKDFPAAVASFEKANQDWIYVQYWLAKANEMAGNKTKAMELYQKIAQDNFNSVFNGLVRNEVKQKTAST